MSPTRCTLSAIIASTLISAPAFAAITAVDDSRQVPQNTAVVIDVLFNDSSDQDGLAVVSTTAPANGTVTVTVDGVRYQPNSGFYGADAFRYTLSNSAGEQATALVSITVTAEAGVETAASIVGAKPQAASNVIRNHREAVSQFLDGGSYASLNDKDVARVNGLLGGAAGDGGVDFGGLFVSVNSRSGEQDASVEADKLQKGFDDSLNGVTLGADLVWNNNWIVGAAVGYSQSEVEFADGFGNFEMGDVSLLGFGAYRNDHLSVQAQLGYSDLDYTFAFADNVGNNRFAFLKGQYIFQTGAWQFIPGLSLNYQNQYSEAYIERQTVANNTPSSFSSQKNRSLMGGLSLSIDRAMTFGWGVFLPRLAVTAEQNINASQTAIKVYSAGVLTELKEGEQDDSHLLVDLGGSFVLPRGLAVFFNLQSLLMQEDYSSNTVQLGLRKEI